MFNKFQHLISTILEDVCATNTAGVNLNSSGSFGSTQFPIPNPTNGTGYSNNLKADMAITGGVNPRKRRKGKKKKNNMNRAVLYTAKRARVGM